MSKERIHNSTDLIELLQKYEKKHKKELPLYFVDCKNKMHDVEVIEMLNDLRLYYNKDDKQVMGLMIKQKNEGIDS